MVSQYIAPSCLVPNDTSINSDNSSSDPLDPSKSCSGEAGCLSKLSEVLPGTETEAACSVTSVWLSDKGKRDRWVQNGKVQFCFT